MLSLRLLLTAAYGSLLDGARLVPSPPEPQDCIPCGPRLKFKVLHDPQRQRYVLILNNHIFGTIFSQKNHNKSKLQ